MDSSSQPDLFVAKAAGALEKAGVLLSVSGDEDHLALSKTLDYLSRNLAAKRGVLFTGPIGVGKTHAARAFARLFNPSYPPSFIGPCDGERVSCTTEGDMRRDAGWGKSYIVDDLGRSDDRNDYGNRSNPFLSLLYTWAAMPDGETPLLFITTNLNSAALSEYCGGAIVSRLVDRLVVCRMTGRDKRMDRAVVF